MAEIKGLGPEPTPEELAKAQAELLRVKNCLKMDFFTTRVQNNALAEGHRVEGDVIVYVGGGNG